MLSDKKTFDGDIHFVLLQGVGEPFSQSEVSVENVNQALSYVGAIVN